MTSSAETKRPFASWRARVWAKTSSSPQNAGPERGRRIMAIVAVALSVSRAHPKAYRGAAARPAGQPAKRVLTNWLVMKSPDPLPQPPRPRRGARPRPPDAQRAKTAILDAAESCFADVGFDGARVDAIAKAAGYNKSLLFQYFGDKRGLYAAVVKRVNTQATCVGMQVLGAYTATGAQITAEEFERLVRDSVGVIFDHLVAHPRALRILAWEEAAGWRTLATFFRELDHSDTKAFVALFEQAREAGVVRGGLKPQIFLVILTSLCRSILTSLPLFEGIPVAREPANPREELIEFILHGLLASPPRRRPSASEHQ